MSRVKSVLLVDFDNIYGATSEEVVSGLSNWLLWLEDGAFSVKNRRRRFIDKRVYWNLQFDKYRPEFERAGFSAFNCRALAKRKISAGKSSADIVLTMDAIEIALVNEDVEEVVILTTDSDFVPVVNRVQAGELRVVTCGKETDPTYDLFNQYADAVVHVAALKAAFNYERAKRKWYRLRSPPPAIAPLTLLKERRSPLMGRVRAALATAETPKDGPPPEVLRAVAIIKELGERMPDQPLSKTRIVRALSVIQEFSPTYQAGLRPWFGHKNFAAMMRRLSQIQPAIEVTTVGKNKIETIWREPAEMPPPKPRAPEFELEPELKPAREQEPRPQLQLEAEPELRLMPRGRSPLSLLAEAAKDADLPDHADETEMKAEEEATDAADEDEEAEAEVANSRA